MVNLAKRLGTPPLVVSSEVECFAEVQVAAAYHHHPHQRDLVGVDAEK